MTSNALIDLFTDVDMLDPEAVARIIQTLEFDDVEHQSKALQSLRHDIGCSVDAIAQALSVPNRTYLRFATGETLMKPVHIRLLAIFLYLRVRNKPLFGQFISASGDVRRSR